MERAECLRALGLRVDATEEEIRQAYHDLVRVWHPDRFQSDPRLQELAADHLRKINEAYENLKGSRTQRFRPARATEAPSKPTTLPRLTLKDRLAGFRLEFEDLMHWPLKRRVAFALAVAAVCVVPLNAALRLAALLRPVKPDTDLIAARIAERRPRILMPSGIIDISGDPRIAENTLAEWARGEALDLWKPVSLNSAVIAARRTVSPVHNRTEDESAAPRRKPAPEMPKPPLPDNGVELINAGNPSGAGEVHIVNRTDLEVVASLRRANTALRAIYIRPRSSASIGHISLGVYRVQLDAGRGLDARQLSFRESAYSPPAIGPLEFFEVSSSTSTSGQYYEVVLKPPQEAN